MRNYKFKSMLSLFLAVSMMLTALNGISFPVTAVEETVCDADILSESITGTTGDCTYTLNGTILTISGDGAMADYSWNGTLPWGTSITEVIIEEGVTTIGSCASEARRRCFWRN